MYRSVISSCKTGKSGSSNSPGFCTSTYFPAAVLQTKLVCCFTGFELTLGPRRHDCGRVEFTQRATTTVILYPVKLDSYHSLSFAVDHILLVFRTMSRQNQHDTAVFCPPRRAETTFCKCLLYRTRSLKSIHTRSAVRPLTPLTKAGFAGIRNMQSLGVSGIPPVWTSSLANRDLSAIISACFAPGADQSYVARLLQGISLCKLKIVP